MGFILRPLFWTLLKDVHDLTAHAAFSDVLNEIITFGEQNSLVTDAQRVRNEMTEERTRSLADATRRRYSSNSVLWPALPGFGRIVNIAGQTWHLGYSMSQIPNLHGGRPAKPNDVIPVEASRDLLRHLVDKGAANIALIDDNNLYGETWDLYLFCKIQSRKKLRAAFELKGYDSQPVLGALMEVCHQISSATTERITVKSNKAEAIRFMRDHDRILLSSFGPDVLTRCLLSAPLTLSAFLEK